MKPSKQQQPKKTFQAEMGDRIKQLSDARIEKQREDNRKRFKQQEDEMMAQIHGPDWRVRYAWEPAAPQRKTEAVSDKRDDGEYDNEYYDDARRAS